jgi:hypothetical protein
VRDRHASQVFEYLYHRGSSRFPKPIAAGPQKKLMRNRRHRERETEFVRNVQDDAEILDEDVHGAQRREVSC